MSCHPAKANKGIKTTNTNRAQTSPVGIAYKINTDTYFTDIRSEIGDKFGKIIAQRSDSTTENANRCDNQTDKHSSLDKHLKT